MVELDLSEAIETGTTASHLEKVHGLKLNDTMSDERRAFAAGLYAALPDLLEALAKGAHGDCDGRYCEHWGHVAGDQLERWAKDLRDER